MATQARKRRTGYFTQKGVALIAVSVATVIVGVLVTEFSTNTNVDMAAARNAEADMKAHFLARSGMNLSQLIIRVQTDLLDSEQIRNMLGSFQITDYTSLFIGAFGGSKEEVEGLGEMLGGFAGDIEGLGVPEGSFDVQITTDDKKINVNCGGDNNTPKLLSQQLMALMYFDAYNPIFENEDAEGWRRDRETQVTAFLDYVDKGTNKFNAPGAPEDYGYESLRDDYEAKNNYLDTVGEIRLIRGVDDRFWSLFGDSFTVYGGCKINLSAIDDPLLLASLILVSAKQGNDPAVLRSENLWALAQLVIKAREFGFMFTRLEDFANFVKSPQDALGALIDQAGADPSASGAASLLGAGSEISALLQQVRGVEIEIGGGRGGGSGGLKQIATVEPRRTYRVEATATYGNMTKRIVGVWDTKSPTNQNTRTPGNVESRARGAWVFWREE